ncbi:MAG TPA: hypothetical protein VHJ17_10560 [Thermomonospora sp.]|nr:hypothetical protein [Thermomonospora sp.]
MSDDIPPRQFREAAAVLAAAFSADGLWNDVRPSGSRRADRALYRFFRGELAIARRRGGIVRATRDGGGRITGVIIAFTDGERTSPWWAWIHRLPAMLLCGVRTSRTLMAKLEQVERAHPREPHVYFYYVGSERLGGGAVLIRKVMKIAREAGLPCYGEAKSPDVVELCTILGWDAGPPIDLGDGHSVTPVWWRGPVPVA